jgi:hypothetical protein
LIANLRFGPKNVAAPVSEATVTEAPAMAPSFREVDEVSALARIATRLARPDPPTLRLLDRMPSRARVVLGTDDLLGRAGGSRIEHSTALALGLADEQLDHGVVRDPNDVRDR